MRTEAQINPSRKKSTGTGIANGKAPDPQNKELRNEAKTILTQAGTISYVASGEAGGLTGSHSTGFQRRLLQWDRSPGLPSDKPARPPILPAASGP